KDGTAIAPYDYVPVTSGSVVIPAGSTTTSISVSVLVHGNTITGPNKTFTMMLTKAVLAPIAGPYFKGGFANILSANSSAIGTILNPNVSASISTTATSMRKQGTSGTTPFAFYITISSPLPPGATPLT